MAKSGQNVLFLFSDEHRRDALGCYGHAQVKTPNLDRLAARGTRFTSAYTSSPICVPARASLAAGEYVHKTRCWSNAQAYQGDPESWGHRLQSQGHRVDSIGKLHYRGKEYDNGFDNEILPLYIRNGVGWIKGLLRDHEAVLDCSGYAADIGPGDSSYTHYDLGVTREACDWLNNRKKTNSDKPWALFVSWLRPHYPLTCLPEFYELYPLDELDDARFTQAQQRPKHPVAQAIRRNFDYDSYFTSVTRQIARASYYGLCSFLDHQVGAVLAALDASGEADNTLIIYTSDHGDHNGDRGLWTKMTLYDESAAVPMIIAGQGIPEAKAVSTLTSLVDIYPAILTAVGADDDGKDRPGIALQTLVENDTFDRAILSEYHDGGSPTGMFMLRNARWKYNYYPGYTPELFDMLDDPDELIDLGESAAHADIRAQCHAQMQTLVDPEAANRLAFADQAERIAELGGVEAVLNSDEFDFTPVAS
ncbi:MAG: sulfatase-like hydrolase/transferase [Gammaproteobacteria bacterium]|nr:sulfatase-like hydrolase/transferase [Gammaproteobacteria bacterium]MDH3466722.1 sulfatase-like hydrolase/transferase [Gammaproteobacteria bacterium]